MAIRFVDKPGELSRKPATVTEKATETKTSARRTAVSGSAEPPTVDAALSRQEAPVSKSEARAAGEARFATPIEAPAPVNPDAAGELPFADLPRAEKGARKKRASKTKVVSSPEEPSLT